jgi:hypothetical protein
MHRLITLRRSRNEDCVDATPARKCLSGGKGIFSRRKIYDVRAELLRQGQLPSVIVDAQDTTSIRPQELDGDESDQPETSYYNCFAKGWLHQTNAL